MPADSTPTPAETAREIAVQIARQVLASSREPDDLQSDAESSADEIIPFLDTHALAAIRAAVEACKRRLKLHARQFRMGRGNAAERKFGSSMLEAAADGLDDIDPALILAKLRETP